MQARRQGGAGGKGKSKGRVVHLYSAFSILICSKALYSQRTGSMHIYIIYTYKAVSVCWCARTLCEILSEQQFVSGSELWDSIQNEISLFLKLYPS